MIRTWTAGVNRPPTGFSLLELVLVLALVATLAAIAAPRYGKAVARYRTEMAARRIVSDLSYARKRAQIRSASQVITFRPASDDYEIDGAASLDDASASYIVKLSDAPYRTSLVSATFGGDAAVTFDGYGVPSAGGQIVISTGEYRKTIVLDAASGKAEAQ